MQKLLYTFIQTILFSAVSCIGFTNLLQAQDIPFIQPVTADQIPASPEIMGSWADTCGHLFSTLAGGGSNRYRAHIYPKVTAE
nr:hypothetical protein [uncultured Dyadobacter sp.]